MFLRIVQRGIHFNFEFNLGDRRRQADPTRKLGDVIFNRFSIDLDMSHHEVSITSQRIEVRNSWFELPSGLPLNCTINCENNSNCVDQCDEPFICESAKSQYNFIYTVFQVTSTVVGVCFEPILQKFGFLVTRKRFENFRIKDEDRLKTIIRSSII